MSRTRWLRHITRDAVVIAFRDWFGLQMSQAEVLATLFERAGRPISPRHLAAELNTHRPLTELALMVRIHGLRAAMNAEAIDTTSDGYLLTEVGIAECRQAFAHEAAALARLGVDMEDDVVTGLPLRRLA